MGHIYEKFGRFSIEGRRESFYIHADYGWRPYRCELGEVRLGAIFAEELDEPPYQVVGQYLGKTFVKPCDRPMEGLGLEWDPTTVVIPLDTHRQPVDQEEDDHPLGRLWRDNPHPEIENNDLHDLIAALEDYRRRKNL